MSDGEGAGTANLAAVLEERAVAHGWGPRPAFAVDDCVYTHADVHEGAGRVASVLSEAGAGPGQRVLVAADDGIELVWAFLGAVRAGAVVVPVNPRLTSEDHRYMAADCGAAVVVCRSDLAERFSPARVVTTEGLAAGLRDRPLLPAAPSRGDAPAYAQYTSGTTGQPKAALHRHGDPLVYFSAFAVGALALGPDDVSLSVSKMFFAYGLGNSLFYPLLSGSRAVLHPGPPRPDQIAELAERHGVTVVYSVPTFYAHLLRSGGAASFTSLRAAVSAGEALTVPLAERLRHSLGCPVLDGLGSTEVGQTFVSNTVERWRDGTVGWPLPPYQVAVRAQPGGDVPADQPGTLWVRGPTVMVEYLGKPDATAAVKDGEWLCTGDRATIDEDGAVRLHGRMDDIEMVGGISVAPREIEELLSGHAAVAEVAVVAVRDVEGASRLEAFVVPAGDAAPDEDVAASLLALARDHLAPHKVPRALNFLGALPRTATGKLRRFQLRSGAQDRGLTPLEPNR